VLHPLNPKYNDMVLNKDIEYRIVGVVIEKKRDTGNSRASLTFAICAEKESF
jgi:hypothetical protein